MNLHDQAQELIEREEQELDERFRQLHDECVELLDEELAHMDQLIRKAQGSGAGDERTDNRLGSRCSWDKPLRRARRVWAIEPRRQIQVLPALPLDTDGNALETSPVPIRGDSVGVVVVVQA